MVYVYEQRYASWRWHAAVARSFFCELRVENYGPDSGVRPHEHTLAPAKEHRFQLLSATKTHLSPVLMLYDDATRRRAAIDEIWPAPGPGRLSGPTAAVRDCGVSTRMWFRRPMICSRSPARDR